MDTNTLLIMNFFSFFLENNLMKGFEIEENEAHRVKAAILQHVRKLLQKDKNRVKKRSHSCEQWQCVLRVC